MSRCLLTTSVGSFPKPAYLKRARSAHERGDLSAEELETLTKKATREAITLQNDLGVDVLVDGEMYRGDMATYFAENLAGFEISGLVRSYGNRYYRKPVCVSEVKFKAPITVDWWNFAKGLTQKPLKAILTGPYTMMDWSFNEFYATRSEFARALALALREEVKALIEAGATEIQIDEPAISVRTDELELAIESFGKVVKGLDAHFYTHICYGDFTKIYPRILDLPVAQLDLEMANSQMDMLRLFQKHKFTKEIGLGVVDSHSHIIEKKDEVKNRIRQAMELVPPERIYVDPDCGLKTRTWDESREKLRVIVEAVRELREELRLD
ncbi:MAG: methionine synthase [Calditrichaeota bacterium]|nr:methionine synthase [Calditrichota bacterium]